MLIHGVCVYLSISTFMWKKNENSLLLVLLFKEPQVQFILSLKNILQIFEICCSKQQINNVSKRNRM